MTSPNDMPADTELRKAINNIMFNKMGNQGWNGSTTALVYIEAIDEVMQLIKARDAAIRIKALQDARDVILYDEQAIDAIDEYIWQEKKHDFITPTDQKEKE